MDTVNLRNTLPRTFYEMDTRQTAKLLLGKTLYRTSEEGLLSGMIVETEAYLQGDPASHAYRGMTERNRLMFGPPGFAYVYFSYGVHDMLNVVTRPQGNAEAVLIRAVMPIDGIEIMRRNRRSPNAPQRRLAAGPGRLTRAFNIARTSDNGADLTDPQSGIWIAEGDDIQKDRIVETTRIGLTKAAEKPWRYYILGNSSVSRK